MIINQSMAKYCSWRTGGRAKYFYTPANIEALSSFLKTNTLPVLWLGLGSNLLIRDLGFDGVVIHTKLLNKLSLNQGKIYAQSGVSLAKLARFSQKNQQYGAEFLSTIPGSVGGALAMNAGCFNQEIWSLVDEIQTIDNAGYIHYRTVNDFDIGYRQVIAHHQNEYFLSTHLSLPSIPPKQSIKDLLQQRTTTQPIGLASCGSVFINPKGYYAGKLIEQSGLKGFCIGGACVSKKHANFIINHDHASTQDIENIIAYIQKTVKQQFNIALVPEVKIYGNPAKIK